MPSKNPSKKALPLNNLLRSVRLHDPLGVRPILDSDMNVPRRLLDVAYLLKPFGRVLLLSLFFRLLL